MSERFYINCPLSLGPVYLDGPEAHHLAGVCRIRVGDPVRLFNGDGAEYSATVTEVAKRTVVLEIDAVEEPIRELPFTLEEAAPLPKGDRTQFLIEKLTELGVTRFVPLMCERSVIHPGAGKLDKLERAVVEASKQCGRNRLMAIEAPLEWRDYAVPREGEVRYLAHPSGEAVDKSATSGAAIRVVVGPEGGFTPAEVSFGVDHGWRVVDLGPRILRVETAALLLAGLTSR